LALICPLVASSGQLGVRRLLVTNACRVEKSFLKGGILARPPAVRQLLIEGLSQVRSQSIIERKSANVHCLKHASTIDMTRSYLQFSINEIQVRNCLNT
jgi:hypothetical protein